MRTSLPLGALLGLPLAFGLVVSLSAPFDTAAYTLTGESLGLDQRGFQVFNNFADAEANDNTAPDACFPGALGATQAIWKAHLEWASKPYKLVGDQDPTQPTLGDGGANFDFDYQGEATSGGSSNANRHRVVFDPNPGGLLAYLEGPISDGWRINYQSTWTWRDGPGAEGDVDIQSVATHEAGHALGLGHSAVSGATMGAVLLGGVAARSIEADDIAGLAALYGTASASKPCISGLSGATVVGGTLVIAGTGFSATGNTVWFTDDTSAAPLAVAGVASTGGGTQLSVTIPAGADDGSVLVRAAGSTGASLSNEWPLDVGSEAFSSLGPSGIGGALGEPLLTGAGDPTPGSATGFDISCTGAQPFALGFLFLSDTVTPTPFFGGTFHPLPILELFVLGFDGAGSFAASTAFDASVPNGILVALQFFFEDATGPFGVTGSNGLGIAVP